MAVVYQELCDRLRAAPHAPLHWMLPSGEMIPSHCHITEVGLVTKEFIDCGGTRRQSQVCTLQLWTANDLDHRVSAEKLLKILEIGRPLLSRPQLSVEVECDVEGQLTIFPLGAIEQTPGGWLFLLGAKQTACLAPDQCGVTGCSTTGTQGS
jgi:hypothetical protein